MNNVCRSFTCPLLISRLLLFALFQFFIFLVFRLSGHPEGGEKSIL